MTNDGRRAELIARLINGLIDDDQGLALEAVGLPRRVNWRAQVDINDTGKLIGKKAAHLYSLRVLITLMGARYGEDWRLEVLDPEEGERSERPPIPHAKNFDPAPLIELLSMILDAILAESATIQTERASKDGQDVHLLRVQAKSMADYEKLVTAVIVGREQLTPVAALGTLFRAYGRQRGAHIWVEVPSK